MMMLWPLLFALVSSSFCYFLIYRRFRWCCCCCCRCQCRCHMRQTTWNSLTATIFSCRLDQWSPSFCRCTHGQPVPFRRNIFVICPMGEEDRENNQNKLMRCWEMQIGQWRWGWWNAAPALWILNKSLQHKWTELLVVHSSLCAWVPCGMRCIQWNSTDNKSFDVILIRISFAECANAQCKPLYNFKLPPNYMQTRNRIEVRIAYWSICGRKERIRDAFILNMSACRCGTLLLRYSHVRCCCSREKVREQMPFVTMLGIRVVMGRCICGDIVSDCHFVCNLKMFHDRCTSSVALPHPLN